MNDNWKVKKVERLGSDYRLTVGPNREMDPDAVGVITVAAILTLVTLYFIGLVGFSYTWWVALIIFFVWLVLHFAYWAVTTILASVSVVVFFIYVFVFA